jgi:hypothetical protein
MSAWRRLRRRALRWLTVTALALIAAGTPWPAAAQAPAAADSRTAAGAGALPADSHTTTAVSLQAPISIGVAADGVMVVRVRKVADPPARVRLYAIVGADGLRPEHITLGSVVFRPMSERVVAGLIAAFTMRAGHDQEWRLPFRTSAASPELAIRVLLRETRPDGERTIAGAAAKTLVLRPTLDAPDTVRAGGRRGARLSVMLANTTGTDYRGLALRLAFRDAQPGGVTLRYLGRPLRLQHVGTDLVAALPGQGAPPLNLPTGTRQELPLEVTRSGGGPPITLELSVVEGPKGRHALGRAETRVLADAAARGVPERGRGKRVLPRTGANTSRLLVLGLLLVAAGTGVLFIALIRRPRADIPKPMVHN